MKTWILTAILSLTGLLSILFYQANNPVSLVILIILVSFNLCVAIKVMFFTSWFSYILFLIFLGGLMVLFIYICSVASNEQVYFKIEPVKVFLWSMSLMLLTKMSLMKMPNETAVFSIENMYSSFNLMIIYTTIVYLLLTLFVSVQVSKMKFGPIRMKKN